MQGWSRLVEKRAFLLPALLLIIAVATDAQSNGNLSARALIARARNMHYSLRRKACENSGAEPFRTGRKCWQAYLLPAQTSKLPVPHLSGPESQTRAIRRPRFPRFVFSSRSTPLLLVRKRSMAARTPGNTVAGDGETFGPVKLSS